MPVSQIFPVSSISQRPLLMTVNALTSESLALYLASPGAPITHDSIPVMYLFAKLSLKPQSGAWDAPRLLRDVHGMTTAWAM